MIGFKCECGPAIDCTYPKCKEGVEMSSKDITERMLDYARDYTTTTYHDALIREAVTEIEFHEERWDQLRQQLAALRDHQIAYETETEQQLASRDAEVEDLRKQLAAKQAERDNWKNSWAVAMEVVDNYAGDPPQTAFEKLRRIRETMDEALAATKEPKP